MAQYPIWHKAYHCTVTTKFPPENNYIQYKEILIVISKMNNVRKILYTLKMLRQILDICEIYP